MHFAAQSFVAGLDFSTLPQQLANGILLGAIYALIALGYTMVYGVLKLINFAHGEVFMLGAYTALFASWALGFKQFGSHPTIVTPSALGTIGISILVVGALTVGVSLALRKSERFPHGLIYYGAVLVLVGAMTSVVAYLQPQATNLFLMLLASMTVCGLVGVTIERLAYRPMRNQARIASLITAIGVSLFLQYGGALVLPNSPPPSINEQVNPYRGAQDIKLVPPDAKLAASYESAKTASEATTQKWEQARKVEAPNSPAVKQLLDAKIEAERTAKNLQRELDNSGIKIRIPTGQLIMLITTLVLMILLRYLVMKTPAGRAMRAVSHDFDSAALMGVNVSRTITFTFLIGSMLAGAGAMMNATFIGTPLTTFYGMQPGVKAFVAAVLGGIGNIPGAVLGGLLMGVAETLVVWVGYSSYRDAIAFVILIIVLLFRPGGLMGSAKVEKV